MSIEDLEFLATRMSAGSVSIGDWETLVHYAQGLGLVIELGTNIGTTAIILSLCAREVITVDVFENLDLIENEIQREKYRNHWNVNKHTYESIKQKLKPYKNITVTQQLSYGFAPYMFEDMVEMIFIDADHSYAGVKKDFEAWFPKIKTGGYIAFHDVGEGCEVFDYYHKELLTNSSIALMPDVATGPCWTKVFKKL